MNVSAPPPPGPNILVIRLGSMGDIIHTMPAVGALKMSFYNSRTYWLVEPRWAPLLEGNPFVSDLLFLDRASFATIVDSVRRLRENHFDFVVDFQGLLKSAIPAWLAHSARRFGFDSHSARESAAALFYTDPVRPESTHIVDRYLDLAVAAGARRDTGMIDFPLGKPEAPLPDGPFVLCSPMAGWPSKQWPLERYAELARVLKAHLGLTLVVNGAPKDAAALGRIDGAALHLTGISGLIYATWRATAVIGLDSGPMHLAAAMGVPGVALFGPTDPARNGPYGRTFRVLRSPRAVTSYRRRQQTDPSMLEITVEEVVEALQQRLAEAQPRERLRPTTW